MVWLVAVLSTAVCGAQSTKEPDTPKESDVAKKSNAAKQRQEKRLDLMRTRVRALSALGTGDEKVEFSETPLLRYNDTARNIADATVWALGRKGRPQAVLVVEVYWPDAVQYELTAVADPPRFAKSFYATPRAAPFTWLKLKGEPPPHGTHSIRRRQIKQAAERFSASEEWRGQTSQLRMMPRPLLEYEDQEKGVIEGAVFVWAHGTNVEILMFLEVRQGEDGANDWACGFGQLSGADLHVDYNGRDFWNSSQGAAASQTRTYSGRKDPLTVAEREAFAPQ
jgi:hypothetical protein